MFICKFLWPLDSLLRMEINTEVINSVQFCIYGTHFYWIWECLISEVGHVFQHTHARRLE